jgi:lysophospholipase L1-like esterase
MPETLPRAIATPESETTLAAGPRPDRGMAPAGLQWVLLSLLCFWLFTAMLSGCGLNRASSRIAFMGDSHVEAWPLPRVNLGKRGQTTSQMLARFPGQVLGHGYQRVIILGGTNDVLLGVPPATTLSNLARMAELAQSGDVEPTLCEIPPIYRPGPDYNSQIQNLNSQIASLAASRHIKLVDYYDPLLNHRSYYSDGIHMNRRGYFTMERAILQVEPLF